MSPGRSSEEELPVVVVGVCVVVMGSRAVGEAGGEAEEGTAAVEER